MHSLLNQARLYLLIFKPMLLSVNWQQVHGSAVAIIGNDCMCTTSSCTHSQLGLMLSPILQRQCLAVVYIIIGSFCGISDPGGVAYKVNKCHQVLQPV